MFKRENIPNIITFTRIAMLPAIIFFYVMAVCSDIAFFVDYGKLVALIIFIVAAATDWVDGYLARKMGTVSDFGKLLDHNADKMLTTLGFLLVLGDPIWYENPDGIRTMEYTIFASQFWFLLIAVFVALARDIIMSTLRAEAARRGTVIAADRLGKTKSLLQFIAIPMYMILAFNANVAVEFMEGGVLEIFAGFAMAILTMATIMSIWSCVNYIRNYSKSLKTNEKKENTNGKE